MIWWSILTPAIVASRSDCRPAQTTRCLACHASPRVLTVTLSVCLRNGGDGALQADLTALSANHLGHGFADFAVIDNAGRIEKQAAQTDDVGLALAQLVGVQAFDLQLIQLRERA